MKKNYGIYTILVMIIFLLSLNTYILLKPSIKYENFTKTSEEIIRSIKKQYTLISDENFTYMIPYPGNEQKKWDKYIGENINDDPLKPTKKEIYIQDENKDIITKIAFNYQPNVRQKYYININQIDSHTNEFLNDKYPLPIVYSTTFTIKGIAISVFTFDISNKTNLLNIEQKEDNILKAHKKIVSYMQKYMVDKY